MMRFISFAILAVIYEAAIANGQTITVEKAVLKEGQPLVLTCEISGFKSVDRPIKWTRNGEAIKADDEHIFINQTATGSTLEIKEAFHEEHAGNYSCVVTVHNGTKTYTEPVPLQEAAHVKPFDKSKNLVQGDRLVLECKPRGDPTPVVSWAKDGEPFSHKTAEFKENSDGIENATLTIPSLEFEDRGEYACIADNKLGAPANATVIVRVKDKLAALWPFLGICAEVAILCTIIFIYEKRRAKKMEEEEAKEEAGHLTNSYDNQKTDVRQRK